MTLIKLFTDYVHNQKDHKMYVKERKYIHTRVVLQNLFVVSKII